MTVSAQEGQYPTTVREWEHLLTRALLRADGMVSDPIRSFEITPETLAQHCGLGPEHAHSAEAAFRQALKADPYLHWSLQNGTARAPSNQVPNCMAMLAMSLLVDSLLDGTYSGNNQYREKLAQWLGINRSFTNLSGIAKMWIGLVGWLEERITAGEPYKALILPEAPQSWTHIGYTRYLSFPTKRDVALLKKVIEKQPKAAEDALTLVVILDGLMGSALVSYGMQAAFQDFRTALRGGGVSADHRFWRLVLRARALAGHVDAPAATLRMDFDEDGERHYRLTTVGSCDAWCPADIGDAAANCHLQASPNLGPAARRGILFFRSSGLATWTASSEPPVGIGPFHVAIADRHLRLASGALATFRKSGTWHVTAETVAASTLYDILRRTGLASSKSSVRTIALADGVHVGRAWLGLPRYLPVVEGVESEISVVRAGGGSSSLNCTGGVLTANGPIEGDFAIGDKTGRWSRRASFVPQAAVHAQLDGAAYRLEEQREWLMRPGSPAQACADNLSWEEEPYRFQDMIEAVYASARSGISEGDLVGLIARAAGARTWDMLRTLQESRVLATRLRERWRGRTFTLCPPTLSDIDLGGAPGVLVSGAMPSRLEADFRQTVEMHGGRPFRRIETGSLAPPLLGSAGISALTLSRALGWTAAPLPVLPSGSAANMLVETSVIGENYELKSEWDWALGRFRVGCVAPGPVSLMRLAHPAGRDHDIYRVIGARRRAFNSRFAAIIDAHQQASQPLFRLGEAGLERIAAEGALPLEVAWALRVRVLANGGASEAGWAYPASGRDIGWLRNLLPGIIEGACADPADPALSYRRGRGARRPLWSAGGIAA